MAVMFVKKSGIPVEPEGTAPRPPRLLTIQEAADYARVSTQTVRRWIKSGELKIYRAGRQIRIDMNDLVELLS